MVGLWSLHVLHLIVQPFEFRGVAGNTRFGTEPLSQLGLAQAYAKQGDSENSRKAYDDFFATWKDANPGIPILRQAKAEYRKLTTPAPAAVSPSGGTAIASFFRGNLGRIAAGLVGGQG
jgi:hypothetical protein